MTHCTALGAPRHSIASVSGPAGCGGTSGIDRIRNLRKIEIFDFSMIFKIFHDFLVSHPWLVPEERSILLLALYGLGGAGALDCKRFRARGVRGNVWDR